MMLNIYNLFTYNLMFVNCALYAVFVGNKYFLLFTVLLFFAIMIILETMCMISWWKLKEWGSVLKVLIMNLLICDKGSTEVPPCIYTVVCYGLYINLTSLRMGSLQIRHILCFSRIVSVCGELSHRQAETGI